MRVGDEVGIAVSAAVQRRAYAGRIAQSGAHHQELGVRQCQQRHLPGPAALRVAVVMELVHRHADIVAGVAAQSLLRQYLRCAADDGRADVNVRVASDHADVLLAEDRYGVEELLADEGLDGRRVVGLPSGAESSEEKSLRHHRFTGPCRRCEDDVVAGDQVHHGFLLVRPRVDASFLHPVEKAIVDVVLCDVSFASIAGRLLHQ